MLKHIVFIAVLVILFVSFGDQIYGYFVRSLP
jgi:hypothetical protein